MKQYLKLLNECINATERETRTGVNAYSVFGPQAEYDLEDGFPLLTTKKIHFRSVIYELLWMLKGDTNIKYLNDNKVYIWDEWADYNGDLGPIYGRQWRKWQISDDGEYFIDQIYTVINEIKNNPTSRRLIVSAWNVADIPRMKLPPCHILFQFYVHDGKLSCKLYQRSADIFLGVPFNIASYSLLTMMIAQICGLKPGKFIHTFGDLHLYENHYKQAVTQVFRDPRELPQMVLNPSVKNIDDFTYEDFQLQNYNPHPHIKAEIAV